MGQDRSEHKASPRFVSAGEALTDFIRVGPDRWLSRPGGADWNVARVVATLGLPSAFAGSVSLDRFGDELIALSEAAGLDMRFTQRYAKPPLLAMVHETAPPQYFFIGAGQRRPRLRSAAAPLRVDRCRRLGALWLHQPGAGSAAHQAVAAWWTK